jgi:hypothetical protein
MWGGVGCDQGLRGGEVSKLLKILATSAVLMMFSASVAMAQEVVKDQENTHTIDSNVAVDGTISEAQTITTATGGWLSHASFYLTRLGESPGPLCADLWSVSSDAPAELQQSLGCVSYSDVPLQPAYGWVDMEFQSSPYMKPGDKYAIVLRSDDANDQGYGWGLSGAYPNSDGVCPRNDYSGGVVFSGDPGSYPNVTWNRAECWDHLFATYNIVDTTAPTGTVLINNGATRTDTRLVTLSLSATDPEPGSGVTEMRFKNEGADAVWSGWKPYAETKNWYLSAGEGTKRVAVQYRDAAGNRSATEYDYIVFRRSR